MSSTSTLNAIIKIVKQGGGDRESVSALVSVKGALSQLGVIMGAAAGAAFALDRIIKATVGEYVKYATQVEDASRVTGLSLENTSRLIQVMDDLFVSQDSLTKGMEFAIRQGFKPSVEWIKQMADEVAAMPAGADRTKRSVELFGKAAGPDMEKLLEQGGDGIQKYMDAVSSGLVVTEESRRKVEEYKRGMDELQDTVTGLKYEFAQEFLPTLISVVQWIDRGVAGWNKYNDTAEWNREVIMEVARAHGMLFDAEHLTDSQSRALVLIQRNLTDAELANAAATVEQRHAQEQATAAAAAATIDYKGLLSLTMNLGQETQNYRDKLGELKTKHEEIQTKIDQLNAKRWLTPAQKTELEQLKTDLQNVDTDITNVGIAHEEAGKKIVYNLLLAKLSAEGLTDAEFDMAIQTGVALGIFDQASGDTAIAIDGLVTQFANGQGTVDDFNAAVTAITNAPHDQHFNITIETVYSSGGATGRNYGGGSIYGGAEGGDLVVTRPTLIMAGEQYTPERVQITPMPGGGNQGGEGTTVNVYLDSRLIQRRLAEKARQRGV